MSIAERDLVDLNLRVFLPKHFRLVGQRLDGDVLAVRRISQNLVQDRPQVASDIDTVHLIDNGRFQKLVNSLSFEVDFT